MKCNQKPYCARERGHEGVCLDGAALTAANLTAERDALRAEVERLKADKGMGRKGYQRKLAEWEQMRARVEKAEAEVERLESHAQDTGQKLVRALLEVERLTKERDEAQANAEADNAEAIRARAERDRAREASAAAFADLSEAARLCVMRDDEYPLKAVQRVAAEVERLREALRRLLEEIDDLNGWRPTALAPGGHAYEQARAALAGAPSETRREDCNNPHHYDPADEIRREVKKQGRALAERVREACVSADDFNGHSADDLRDAVRALDLDALLEER